MQRWMSASKSPRHSFLWSLFLVGVVFLTAKPIATWFLGDSSLTYTILATCPLMILMSISNIVKGHFLGLAKIKVPSAINISEKILRFPILYCLIKFCLNKTSFPPVTLIYLCYAIGEMQSVLFLMIYYKKTKPKVPPLKMKFELVGSTLKPLIKGATPICLTQCLMEFVNAFSSVIVKSRLCSIGYTAAEAFDSDGQVQRHGFPLMNYPMILVASTCSIVVPKISTMMATGKSYHGNRLIHRALLTALAIGMLTGIIFWFLADEMGMFFYKNDLTWMIRLAGLCAPSAVRHRHDHKSYDQYRSRSTVLPQFFVPAACCF